MKFHWTGLFCMSALMVSSLWGREPDVALPLTFAELSSFEYSPEVPEDRGVVVRDKPEYLQSFMPDKVMAFDGATVEISGYMLPLTLKGNRVKTFLLMPNTQACCYGMMPNFNEYVLVKMTKTANALENVPVRVVGKFTIEEAWESGYFSHLYRLTGKRVDVGPKPLF